MIYQDREERIAEIGTVNIENERLKTELKEVNKELIALKTAELSSGKLQQELEKCQTTVRIVINSLMFQLLDG